jgi:hypothetical protein
MLAVVPHFIWPALFALLESLLLSGAADCLPAFCEFWERVSVFETVNSQSSLFEFLGDRLVAVLFEFAATETGGQGALGPDDCELPSAVAVRAIRELAGFAAGLIRENWRDWPQRREAAMALLALTDGSIGAILSLAALFSEQ